MKLNNKIVLVTGGSGGLGEQICYEAAKEGAVVIVCARRKEAIEKVRTQCMQYSRKQAYAFVLDIGNPKSIDDVYQKIKSEVGTVDILVNNAGFGLFEEFLTFDMEKARQMFEVNVLGLMVLTQKVAIDMAERKRGHIFNVASMAGKMATAKSTIYSATKFAVVGFSNALRLELKPLKIHVTTINPGPIATNFFDSADPTGKYLEKVDQLVLDANKLAKTVVQTMYRPKREINQPVLFEVGARLYALFPTLGDILANGIFNKK